jgi:hypothetical protein
MRRVTSRSLKLTAEAISGELFGEEALTDFPSYLHSLLAQLALPYRPPPPGARDYRRDTGRGTLILSAGYLEDPATREVALQPLPSGAKPRLLLVHVCTEAVRRRSPLVPIAGSMSALMRTLGLQVTGGRHGTIAAFKDQMNRLHASNMRIIWRTPDRTRTLLNAQPFDALDVWFPPNPDQRQLWPTSILLTERFYESLREHALPLETQAIRMLQHSPRALDAYAWLVLRLPRVRAGAGDLVSWPALLRQFGGESATVKAFRPKMLRALRQALDVYPRARIGEEPAGLRLHHSPPPVGPRLEAPPA